MQREAQIPQTAAFSYLFSKMPLLRPLASDQLHHFHFRNFSKFSNNFHSLIFQMVENLGWWCWFRVQRLLILFLSFSCEIRSILAANHRSTNAHFCQTAKAQRKRNEKVWIVSFPHSNRSIEEEPIFLQSKLQVSFNCRNPAKCKHTGKTSTDHDYQTPLQWNHTVSLLTCCCALRFTPVIFSRPPVLLRRGKPTWIDVVLAWGLRIDCKGWRSVTFGWL